MTPPGPLGAKMTEEMAKSRISAPLNGVWGGLEGVWGGVQGPDPVLGHRLLAISSVIWRVWGPGGVIQGSKWGFKGGEIPLLAHLDP